jgi:hypothetical protein
VIEYGLYYTSHEVIRIPVLDPLQVVLPKINTCIRHGFVAKSISAARLKIETSKCTNQAYDVYENLRWIA